MPAKSPQPTPRRESDGFLRPRSETPSSFAATTFMRKSLVTPSPAGTAATESMTPSPLLEIPSSVLDSVTPAPDSIQRPRSFGVLQEEDHRGDIDMRTPEGEWRIRALFLEEDQNSRRKSPQIHKRARSFQGGSFQGSSDSSNTIPPLPPRSSLSTHTESDSAIPPVAPQQHKSSRRRSSRSQKSCSTFDEEWTTDRRRSSSSAVPVVTPHKRPLAESSSSENSPDTSPTRTSKTIAADAGSSIKMWITLRLGRMRTNRLVFYLCLVGVLSLGLTILTNRAVSSIHSDGDLSEKDIESYWNGYETLNPPRKHPPQGGLRGLPGLKPRHKKDHNKKDDTKKPATDVRKPHHKTDDKKKHDSHHVRKPTPPKKPKKTAPVKKTKLHTTVAAPKKKVNVKSRSFKEWDPKMFDPDATAHEKKPRVVRLHESIFEKTPAHHVQVYPADYTDNTQLYGVLDSSDERLSRMELRDPYSDEHCVPMQDWQTTYNPSCNGMHEMALDHMVGDGENDVNLFGTKGYWRNAWKVDVLAAHHRPEDRESVVLKTLKFQHKFEDAHFEHDRIDAVAMERLTSSPHVINVFGFCGHSVVTEYAEGTRVGELADKSKKKPLARLRIARDIANGLADVHGIDGDGNATFVHLDINPANVVSIGGTLKLNDFNIGIIRRWNQTSNQPCGFPAQYPNPQWRSPEEARNEQNLTEKVDVFSMGHIFFRLICGHEPWNKLEIGGRPSKEEINAKVKKGVLPHIPKEVMESTDKEVIAIRNAMLSCYTFHPEERPSARVIANALQSALETLSPKPEKYA